ncbi:flagellar basal body P-ring formation chaperone FlgA [Sulfurimonas sp. HSL-1716]|uniref:flagellar basal body P-ring formation chaperone FlgA n=1 Tax=Hydrocurvibacter sulfurireducens TaxID=3131937 RepID=UPI0031F90547
MLFRYIFLFFLFLSSLYSYTLQENYETKGRDIYASDIIKNIDKDFLLFSYDETKQMLRVNAKEVMKIFKKNGYVLKNKDVRYVNFRQKSPVNMQDITNSLRKEFLSKYPDLRIKSLKVYPRSYITALPKIYSLSLQSQTLHKNYSTVSIVTPEHKMIFFDYILDATIDVIITTKKIDRHEELTYKNTKIKTVKFTSFRNDPVTDIKNHKYQSKFSLKSDFILTENDIEKLSLVKRDETVVATIHDGGLSITFNAVAVQDGKEGDIIAIRKANGKKLMAKVIGRKRVEIQ